MITKGELGKELDQVVIGYRKKGFFNGSALVAFNGEPVYKKSFGYADRVWKVPNKPDTKFMMGSNSKQFTALIIMQLVEMGLLHLDQTISHYLPYFRRDWGRKITIKHLLTHTSGIPNYNPADFFTQHDGASLNTEKAIILLTNGELDFVPGAKFSYCNTGYYILGDIIEKLTGDSYENVLQKNILVPLNMQNTGYFTPGPKSIYYAHSYIYEKSGLIQAEIPKSLHTFAAGNIYSTVEDLILWDRALYSDLLISKESRKLMFSPELNNYAFGWVRVDLNYDELTNFMLDPLNYSTQRSKEQEKELTMVIHRGQVAGFSSLILRIINSGLLIILLSNVLTPVFPEEISCDLLEVIHNQGYI